MNFFKYELKEIKEDANKLGHKIERLETHVESINTNYFVFLLHKNIYSNIEKIVPKNDDFDDNFTIMNKCNCKIQFYLV